MKTIYKIILSIFLPCLIFANNKDGVYPQKKTPFYEYNNRIAVFSVNHLLYERIKPNGIYAAVDIWATWAGTTVKNEKTKFDHWFSEAEYRMGYNFFLNGRDHITPIAGIGFLKSDKDFESSWDNHRNYKPTKYKIPGVVYFTAGFMYNHEFNSILNLGFNLKGLIGGGGSNDYFRWGSAISGFDVSVPISFRFGPKRHWDLRLEPFNIFLISKDNWVNTFGGRGTLGYRF